MDYRAVSSVGVTLRNIAKRKAWRVTRAGGVSCESRSGCRQVGMGTGRPYDSMLAEGAHLSPLYNNRAFETETEEAGKRPRVMVSTVRMIDRRGRTRSNALGGFIRRKAVRRCEPGQPKGGDQRRRAN